MAEAQLTEEWRPVVGYEETHEVSCLGTIRLTAARRGYRLGYILRPTISTRGYRRIRIIKNGRINCIYVHKIVAEAFLGPCPPGLEINHKNFLRQDNRASNLEYVTHAENVSSSVKSAHYAKKLTPSLAVAVKARLKSGDPQWMIAQEFGVCQQLISDIKRGVSWGHANEVT